MPSLPPGTLILCGLLAEARLWPFGTRVLATGGRPATPDGPRPSAILSFGLCGGLDPALRPGALLAATTIPGHGPVDGPWAAALAAATGARPAVLAHSPRAVATPTAKAGLRAATGAAAVDMESGFGADLAARWGIPFAALRAVGDTAGDSVPESAALGLNPDGSTAPGRVALALLRRPGDLPGLLHVAWRSRAGMRALRLAAAALRA